MKKMMAMLAILSVMSVTLAGCGDSVAESNVASADVSESEIEVEEEEEDTEEEEIEEDSEEEEEIEEDSEEEEEDTDAEEDDALSAYVDALANTVWCGMDIEYHCFVMAFGDEKISIAADDDSSIDGYWGVQADDPTIYIYSDAELTDEIGKMPWTYDFENEVMILNDTVIMAESDATSLEASVTELEKMSTAAKTVSALNGTVWAGALVNEANNTLVSTLAVAFAANDDAAAMALYECADGETIGQGVYMWSMNYDTLSLYDTNYNLVRSFEWGFDADNSLILTDINGNGAAILTQLTEEEAAADDAIKAALAETYQKVAG